MKNYRTSTIFDFSDTYLAQIKVNNNILPVKVYFFEHEIRLALITENISLSSIYYESDKIPLKGEVYTIEGLKKFKLLASLINFSERFNGTSFYEFRVWSMFIYNIKDEFDDSYYSKVNFTFKNLHRLGKLVDFTPNANSEYPYNINKSFEKVLLLDNDDERISIKNQLVYRTNFSEQQVNIFTDAYIEIKKDGMTIEYIGEKIEIIGWFLQLIFRNKQDENGVFLFPHGYAKETEGCHYFRSEIIACLQSSNETFIRPGYNLEDLQTEILIGFKRWNDFTTKQKLFCRLYFNEINAKVVNLDDRFKNLCALIQGLEMFGVKKTLPKKNVKNGMANKLADAASYVTNKYFNDFQQSFFTSLYTVIGCQRDFYQHMNKPLKYDLGKEDDDLMIVNDFLGFVIKSHLIRSIDLEKNLNQFLASDRKFVNGNLRVLETKLKRKGVVVDVEKCE